MPLSPWHIVPAILLCITVLVAVEDLERNAVNNTGREIFFGQFCIAVLAFFLVAWFLRLGEFDSLIRFVPGRQRAHAKIVAATFAFTARVWLLSAVEANAIVLLIWTDATISRASFVRGYFIAFFVVIVGLHVLFQARRLGTLAWKPSA